MSPINCDSKSIPTNANDDDVSAVSMPVSTVPDEFICPITHEMMRNPLMTRYGQTFEHDAILTWLADHNGQCPLTRKPLTVRDLVRNRVLQQRIQAWVECQPIHDTGGNGISSKSNDDTTSTSTMILLTCLKSDFESRKSRSSREKSKEGQSLNNSTTATKRSRVGILRRILRQ